MRRYFVLCLSVLVVLPGCASYKAGPAPVPKTAAIPFSRIENSVMVAVDPHVQTERQKEIFDADLKSRGLLPLYLFVENRGEQTIFLSRSAIALEIPDGRQISSVGGEAVAHAIPRGGGLDKDLVEVLFRFPPFIPLVIAGAVANMKAAETAADARRADYMNKEFQDVELGKNASAHGFVYFKPPAGTLWSTKARLSLRFLDKTDGASFVIRVPVSESGFFQAESGNREEENK